jgi:hypothetical protein
MGEWQEVGLREPPLAPEPGSFVVTTTAPGEGAGVSAGDLVKARVVVTTVDMFGRTSYNPKPQDVWVWTGREPQRSAPNLYKFGSLGSAKARAALIGRHLHEQFEMHMESSATAPGQQLPLRGIIVHPQLLPKVAAKIDGEWTGPLEWPALDLTPHAGNPSAQVEILQVCSARLYQRTATLRQAGMIFASGDLHYGSWRKGTLGWTAIDAQCPGPDGHVRLQAGPLYDFNARDPEVLADWGASYEGIRPAQRHREEWRVPSR